MRMLVSCSEPNGIQATDLMPPLSVWNENTWPIAAVTR